MVRGDLTAFLAGLIVLCAVRIAGGPPWAAVGFALTIYICVPREGGG